MKTLYTYIIAVSAVILLCTNQLSGQERGKGLQKIDQYEKANLIDALQMDEKTSITFFTKRRDFKEKQRITTEQISSQIEELRVILDSKTAEKDINKIKKYNDDLLRLEAEMHKLRTDYLHSLSDILTPEQIGKYIIFEKDFRKDIRNAVINQKRWHGGKE